MASPLSTLIDSGDPLRIRNDHPTEVLVLKVNNRVTRVEPGKAAIVPFEVVRVHWGDPRSHPGRYEPFQDGGTLGKKGWVNKREDEIIRLGNLYGSFARSVEELNDPEWPVGTPEREKGIVKHVPHPISVQTQDGTDIDLPCFDESGEKIYGSIRMDGENLNDEVTYRNHLEKQLDDIRGQLAAIGQGSATDDSEVDGARS